MDIKVLVTAPIDKSLIKMISDVNPSLKVQDVSDLSKADHAGDQSAGQKLNPFLADAEIIYGHRMPPNLIARAPKLKWLQVMSAGVDRFLDSDFCKSPVILTNVSGMHATPIGEFVMGQMLMFAKSSHIGFELKQNKQWRRYMPSILRGKTVGIVGLGNIGREVARLSKAFGMKVIATRRSSKPGARARNVDLMLSQNELPKLLADSDYVVIALPYTKETDDLFREKELKAMKPTAYLCNIGRGRIINEDALVKALEENWIAGAALDVFATEPLRQESKLWELPNLIFSPHISGGMDNYNLHATEIFCRNLERYVAGKKLFNIVNKRLGY